MAGSIADSGGRAVWGVVLCPFAWWGCGFESVAGRSKARVCGRSLARVAGFESRRGMDVCVLSVKIKRQNAGQFRQRNKYG